tara:strand:- start:1195 stop:1986 length:792 start_codon:yes stop_codon:yes gene_type:complete
MLVKKEYKVLVTNRNISKFKDKYNTKSGEYCLINVSDLSKGSHLRVDVKCDRCDIVFGRTYKSYLYYRKNYDYDTCNKCKYEKVEKTNIEKFGVSNPFQSEKIKDKIKETWIDNYGVDNPAKSEIIQERIKKTNLEKYGYEYGLSDPDIRTLISKTKSDKGLQRPTEEIEEFRIYRNRVNNITKLIKPQLLENWNGYDYYDSEYIKENFELDHNDKNYPTIDHKTSVLYGFLNNISEEDISNISNLCITKRSINSTKGYKNKD